MSKQLYLLAGLVVGVLLGFWFDSGSVKTIPLKYDYKAGEKVTYKEYDAEIISRTKTGYLISYCDDNAWFGKCVRREVTQDWLGKKL